MEIYFENIIKARKKKEELWEKVEYTIVQQRFNEF